MPTDEGGAGGPAANSSLMAFSGTTQNPVKPWLVGKGALLRQFRQIRFIKKSKFTQMLNNEQIKENNSSFCGFNGRVPLNCIIQVHLQYNFI